MIVHRNGQGLFRMGLTDNVLIQKLLDLAGAGDGAEQRLAGGQLAFFLADDVVGQVHAIGADVNLAGSLDHRSDVAGRFSAEAAGGDPATAETTL